MRRHLDHDRPRDECDWDDVVWIYDPMEQMIESLEKLVTGYPPKNQYDGPECKGLYSGPTSIAYLFLQLSRSHPNLQINGFPPEVWLMWYLEGDRTFAAVTLEKNGISSEILAYHAVFAAAGGNDAISSEMLAYHAVLAAAAGKNGFQVFQNFLDLIKAIAQSDKKGSNNWLCGRAGCLYLLRLVRHWSPPAIGRQMNPLIAQMIDATLEHEPSWPIEESAVYGRIGIITQIILCDPSKTSHPSILQSMEEVVEEQEDKNWNYILTTKEDHGYLVQFCEGASGINISMRAIAHDFADGDLVDRMWEAIEMNLLVIFEQGLLTKEPNLCHGVTGNALGCEYRERRFLMEYSAKHAIEQGLQDGTYTPSDDPYGLFCGEAGRVWGWLNVLSGEGDERGMIGYNDV